MAGTMDESSLSAWADELDSKDTKRRLQALEALGEALQLRPWAQPPGAAQEELARAYDDNSWRRIVAPLVRTLRDNNFKVCRASLACLESLVARVTENETHRGRIGGSGSGSGSGTGSGNANSIVPFLSLITPAVVDCLGNSKSAVQEKGVSVLLAISDPTVAGAHDTISSVQHHFGHHRNWRVRERLVAYLGRVAELDAAGISRIQQQRGVATATVAGEETSLLAGLVGDALNDSASQVRQEALTAAARVLEVLPAGDRPLLLAQLEAKGVRRAALSILRESSTKGKGGGTNNPFDDNPSSAGGLLSPVTPAPSSSSSSSRIRVCTAATRTAHRAAAVLPAGTTRKRRPASGGETTTGRGGRRATTSSTSILTRGAGAGTAAATAAAGGGGGGGVGASTPTGAVAMRRGAGGGSGRAVSPTTALGISPRGVALSSGSGDDSAFSALEPLETVTVYTERDVRREVEAAKRDLEHGSDWQKWVSAMRRLAGVALGGGGSEFPALLVGLVRASVHEMVGHKVSENRSAVAREACRCVAVLARCLTEHFGALAELWLPELIRNTTRAVVVAAAGDEAARAVFGCTKDGFPRLLQYLIDTSKNRSAAIRHRCLDYVMLALARWSKASFDRYAPQIRDMINAAIGDADSSVRATARRAYWVLKLRFPDLAESVMGSLAPSMQRHVLREDREFDAEAFVRAADAAAENPQVALGEHKHGCLVGDNDDDDIEHGGVAADAAAARPGTTDLQAPQPSAASTTRRMHGTYHGSSAPNGGGGYQPPQRQRRPLASDATADADSTERSGDGLVAGRAAARSSTRMKVKVDSSAASGEGNARVLRGAPARRTRPGKLTVQNGVHPPSPGDDAGDGDGDDFGASGGGDGADGSRYWDSLSALRVADGGAAGGVRVAGDATAASAASTAKIGAFRVPRVGITAATSASETARVSGGGGGSGNGEPSHQRSPATRVVARRQVAVAPAAAAGGGGDRQGFGGSGTLGAASKVGRGAQLTRVVGRHQQQRLDGDGGMTGRQREEAGDRRAEAVPMRAVVSPSVSVVLDRRDVLRQMDELADQAGASHWAARTEALERMLQLLTVEGGSSGDGDVGGGTRGEGGRFVLESRPASRRLEAVIAERARDANFRVVVAALNLLRALVDAHPVLMAGHVSALLSSVFPNLADAKEPVRLAANGVLNACRAAYPPHQLCSSLCPRVLELPPGRARTGMLEFLAVLVPHSASFLLQGKGNQHSAAGGGGGHLHLQSLTKRVAAALVQSPPPANWDGGLGDNGPTSAGSAASAAIRLLTALLRLDRDALAAAVVGLPPDSVMAVRRALSFCHTPSSSPAGKVGVGVSAGNSSEAKSCGVVARAGGSSVRPPGPVLQEHVLQEQEDGCYCAVVTPVAGGSGRVGYGGEVVRGSGGIKERSPLSSPSSTPPPPPAAAAGAAANSAAIGTPATSTSISGNAFSRDEEGESRGSGEGELASLTPPLQQQKPRRQPLAPVTPRDTNRQAGERTGWAGCVGVLSAVGGKRTESAVSPAVPTGKGDHAAATPASIAADPTIANSEERKTAEVAAVAQRLISGLSRGARSHQKVEALSSLRRLADGEGVGGRPEFWPRYFGQVLMLLLEGAVAGDAGEGGSLSSSPSRRRVLLRAKHLQGVRCLVARRGDLFTESAEFVVGRLVEVGAGAGDACLAVGGEAEACLADLAGVLDPARYLEVLTPLVALLPDNGGTGEVATAAADGGCGSGGRFAGEVSSQLSRKRQCFVLGALRALTPRLSSPTLLRALGAGPLLTGLETALGGRDLEARKRAVLALVEMYQVLEEALLPFLANFPTTRLKLITMYIEQRRVKDNRTAAAAAAAAAATNTGTAGFVDMDVDVDVKSGVNGGVWTASRETGARATRFTPIR
eukprot:g17287.t1